MGLTKVSRAIRYTFKASPIGLKKPFAVPREASRLTGVAPLSVFFTGGYSPSSPFNRDFHDLFYHWDFGDPGQGVWPGSGKDKNRATGGCSSHLFEAPGSYTVTLNVWHTMTYALLDSETFTIVVTDPEVVFSGANTICFTSVARSSFEGAPAGSVQVITDSLDNDMPTHFDSNKRLLLDRGSVWDQNDKINFANRLSNIQIGAYGTGINPDVRGIFDNAPLINLTGSQGCFDVNRNLDMTIMDINLNGTTVSGGILTGDENLGKS
jgi:hypothetical protein